VVEGTCRIMQGEFASEPLTLSPTLHTKDQLKDFSVDCMVQKKTCDRILGN
jgi:hypothetical protein